MTVAEIISFSIVVVTVILLVWGRLAYDLVAVLALLAGLLTGVVSPHDAFRGFSDEVVVIIILALVVSAAVARSGAIEALMHPILPRLRTERLQVPVLAGAVALLSAFSKNVGALAIFMPVAAQLSRRNGTQLSALLMPMSFASLLGGLATLIGTSPNIIVSQVRHDMLGHSFAMFDYLPVGATIALLGWLFLAVGYRLVPRGRKAAPGMEAAFNIDHYATEARVSPDSPLVGETVGRLERDGGNVVRVTTVIRERFRHFVPGADWVLAAGDILLLEGDPEDLERIVARARLHLAGEQRREIARATENMSVVEGVVTAASPLVGRTPPQLQLAARHGLNLVAVSRSGGRASRRLASTRFREGDVLVLKGPTATLPDALATLHVLPLAERRIALGRSHRGWLPGVVLLGAMGLIISHLMPVQEAFLLAAAILVLFRVLSMHEAYESVEWSLVVLLGALIPVSHAITRSGGADLIASHLVPLLTTLPPTLALGLVLIVAMAATPVMHNAPTVLVLAPVAVKLALRLHLNPDAFLMAVALGAGCDFLTPIGHQCNTLIYGPGGYRFGDYWRLGLPLSTLVATAGTLLIAVVWGLH